MMKRLFGKGDKYESIQRKIKNLEKELKAFGSKHLSPKEEQRFYKRYKGIIECIERNKFSDDENQQLYTNINTLRTRYSFLVKMEQRESEGSGRRYYLRSSRRTTTIEEGKVQDTTLNIDDFVAIKNNLESLSSDLKSTNASSLSDDLIENYEFTFKSLTSNIEDIKSVQKEDLEVLLNESLIYFQNLIEAKRKLSETKSYNTSYPTREFRNSNRYPKDENSCGISVYGCWNKPSANTPRSEKFLRGSGFGKLETESFTYENEKQKRDLKEQEDLPKVHEFGKERQTSSLSDSKNMDSSASERKSTSRVAVYKQKYEQIDRDYHRERCMININTKEGISTRTNSSCENYKGILKHDSLQNITKDDEETVVAEEAQESSFSDTQKEFEEHEKKSDDMDHLTRNENKSHTEKSVLNQTRGSLNKSQIREPHSYLDKEIQTSVDNIKSSRVDSFNNFTQVSDKDMYYRDKNLSREPQKQTIEDSYGTPGKGDYKNTYKTYHVGQDSYKSNLSHVDDYSTHCRRYETYQSYQPESHIHGNQTKSQEVMCSVVEHSTATKPQEVKEQPLQIIDVHQYFRDDFDFNIVESLDVVGRIEAFHDYAKTFEDTVKNFNGEKFSLDYFVIDEKLMRLIEKLDKIRCQHDDKATQKKVDVISYIKGLHVILDKRAKDD